MKFSFSEEKLILGFFSIFFLGLVALLGLKFPAIATVYGSFVGGVTGLYGLYVGGNSVHRYIDSKQPDHDKPPQSS